MPVVNFRPVSSILETERRAFPVNDSTILKPGLTTSLFDGEWLVLDAQSGKPVWKRGSNEETNWVCGPVWFEQGATDVQVIQKAPVIISGNLEAHTRICDTTNLTATGHPLVVADCTIDGNTKRGLKKAAGNGQHNIYAFYVGPGELPGMVGSTGIIRVWIKSPIQITI